MPFGVQSLIPLFKIKKVYFLNDVSNAFRRSVPYSQ